MWLAGFHQVWILYPDGEPSWGTNNNLELCACKHYHRHCNIAIIAMVNPVSLSAAQYTSVKRMKLLWSCLSVRQCLNRKHCFNASYQFLQRRNQGSLNNTQICNDRRVVSRYVKTQSWQTPSIIWMFYSILLANSSKCFECIYSVEISNPCYLYKY